MATDSSTLATAGRLSWANDYRATGTCVISETANELSAQSPLFSAEGAAAQGETTPLSLSTLMFPTELGGRARFTLVAEMQRAPFGPPEQLKWQAQPPLLDLLQALSFRPTEWGINRAVRARFGALTSYDGADAS